MYIYVCVPLRVCVVHTDKRMCVCVLSTSVYSTFPLKKGRCLRPPPSSISLREDLFPRCPSVPTLTLMLIFALTFQVILIPNGFPVRLLKVPRLRPGPSCGISCPSLNLNFMSAAYCGHPMVIISVNKTRDPTWSYFDFSALVSRHTGQWPCLESVDKWLAEIFHVHFSS